MEGSPGDVMLRERTARGGRSLVSCTAEGGARGRWGSPGDIDSDALEVWRTVQPVQDVDSEDASLRGAVHPAPRRPRCSLPRSCPSIPEAPTSSSNQ
jgi:hypothetical protein